MVGVFSWLKRKNDKDWEKTLSVLDSQIRHTERRLSELRIRERKLIYAWLFYSLPLYFLVVVAYFTYLKPRGDPWDIWLWKTGIVVAGAPIIYFVHRMIRIWYRTREKSELDYLETLKERQQEKVEELKKETAYYKTKGLLERYDSPVKKTPGTPSPKDLSVTPPEKLASPTARSPTYSSPTARGPQPQPGDPNAMRRQPLTQASPVYMDSPNSPFSPMSRDPSGFLGAQPPVGVPPKGWFDKVVDVIIGDNEGPANKYALICEDCFTHNGLVPPHAYSNARFRCMKCDHLNAPKNYDHLAFGGTDRRASNGSDVDASFLSGNRLSRSFVDDNQGSDSELGSDASTSEMLRRRHIRRGKNVGQDGAGSLEDISYKGDKREAGPRAPPIEEDEPTTTETPALGTGSD
ncbi:hypothetical protein DFS34DRAFT_693892 [Phlyctochytrium arcticum]|nr:hypothetical protein DFS34DRAFT_693892 [Phlyctochytrium arcticum]